MKNRIIKTVVAFCVSAFLIGLVLPAVSCMDGWSSPSIGRSGACSHHGGVNTLPQDLAIIFSCIVAFITWKLTKEK